MSPIHISCKITTHFVRNAEILSLLKLEKGDGAVEKLTLDEGEALARTSNRFVDSAMIAYVVVKKT